MLTSFLGFGRWAEPVLVVGTHTLMVLEVATKAEMPEYFSDSAFTHIPLASGKNRPPPSAFRPGGKSIFRPFSGKKGGKLLSFVCHGKRAENIPYSALQFFSRKKGGNEAEN